MILADDKDIASWAIGKDAQERFPELIRRLIHATCSSTSTIDFPSIDIHGWDGIVIIDEVHAYVPYGLSCWELSTQGSITPKANDDYNKRTENPLYINPAETTFVFATPRKWNSKTNWIKDKIEEDKWKSIKAYDAANLYQWMEQAYPVHIWFSRLINKITHGAIDLDFQWEKWSKATNPPTSAKLVMAGRDEQRKEALTQLGNNQGIISIQDETKQDGFGFIMAVLNTLDDHERIKYVSRGVVVTSQDAFNMLMLSKYPLILIPMFENPEGIGQAASKGHQVIILCDKTSIIKKSVIQIPRIRTAPALNALVEMGVPMNKVEPYSHLVRRSLLALRRKIGHTEEFQRPKWADLEKTNRLQNLLLVQKWDQRNTHDVSIISKLLRIETSDLDIDLLSQSNQPDALIRLQDNIWNVISMEDAWELLNQKFTLNNLMQFEGILIEVLGEIDPAIGLHYSQQHISHALGLTRKYSDTIRKGIAECLAIIGSNPKKIADNSDIQVWIDKVVYQLFNKLTTFEMLESTADLFPILAEAAPDIFINFIRKVSDDNLPLFQDFIRSRKNDTPFFSTPPVVYLIWSLESLSWCDRYRQKSLLLLSQIASLLENNFSGIQNKAFISLRNILAPWNNRIPMNTEAKLSCLQYIRIHSPYIAWAIMKDLVLQNQFVTTQIHTPRWREWIPENMSIPHNTEIHNSYLKIISFMYKDHNYDVLRLIDMIECIPYIVPNRLIQILDTIDRDGLSSKEQIAIWEGLRKAIAHVKFMTKNNTITHASYLPALEVQYSKFIPPNLSDRYSWLFMQDGKLFSLFEGAYDSKSSNLKNQRIEAVKHIYNDLGLDGLLDFATNCDAPSNLGQIIVSVLELTEQGTHTLISGAWSQNYSRIILASSYIHYKCQDQGYQWLDSYLQSFFVHNIEQTDLLNLLLALLFQNFVWQIINIRFPNLVIDYWSQVNVIRPNNLSDALIASQYLLSHNRAHAGLLCLAYYNYDIIKSDSELVYNLLIKAYNEDIPINLEVSEFASIVNSCLALLQADEAFDFHKTAEIEWKYLKFMGDHNHPTCLHRELAESPFIFIEDISLLYKSETEIDKEYTDEDSQRANHAFSLLSSWKTVPGLQPDGMINADKLREWIRIAIISGTELHLLNPVHKHIGQILSFSPFDTDGIWPDTIVREILEERNNPEIEHGLQIQILNNRGVYTKAILDGGSEERNMATKFIDDSSKLQHKWPRIATVLRNVGNYYNEYAVAEDIRAEHDEDGL